FVNLFVSRGRAELGQRRQQAQGQVAQAKAMGEFAVNFGGPKVREHVEKGIAMARKSAEAVLGGAGEDELPGAGDDVPPPARDGALPPPARHAPSEPAAAPSPSAASEPAGESTPASAAPKAATLGIPVYDGLSASQAVERLHGPPPRPPCA